MTALPPELAIAYVRALSCDVRGAAVLAADGAVLAGAEPRGDVVRARTERHEIAVALGPHALPALVVHDAERVLRALEIRK